MKIDRLLSMILLMLKREKITAAEMAEYFETSPRTIYRDIETLCMAGIPVVSEPGVNGGYSLMEGFTLDRQVFKVDEILALIAGLKGMEKVFDSPSVRQTVEKVEHLAGRKRKDQIRTNRLLKLTFSDGEKAAASRIRFRDSLKASVITDASALNIQI